jgi:hypothetical protein
MLDSAVDVLSVVMPGLGPGTPEVHTRETQGCPAFAGHDDRESGSGGAKP